MTPKILIIGSTGKLGIKLLKFCHSKNINIFGITCFNNYKLLLQQSKKYKINHFFKLSDHYENLNFKLFLKKNKFDIIYFLDYGYKSLSYIDIFLKYNQKSHIAIANKEMIIAGGDTLIDKIYKTNNKLIPLDSEHFSLIENNITNEKIKKIYITASGGPFYFKKTINLNSVKLSKVLDHPKWKMGINNSIDSSNFINKILEIFELSIIYKIDLHKIDFLISREAYVHSLVINNNNIININCFDNDMIYTLANPLFIFFPSIMFKTKTTFFKTEMLKLQKFNDKRFKIYKHLSILKDLTPDKQIRFMVLNNIAQKKYLSEEIRYNEIINFIMKNLKVTSKSMKFRTLSDRLKFIDSINLNYD